MATSMAATKSAHHPVRRSAPNQARPQAQGGRPRAETWPPCSRPTACCSAEPSWVPLSDTRDPRGRSCGHSTSRNTPQIAEPSSPLSRKTVGSGDGWSVWSPLPERGWTMARPSAARALCIGLLGRRRLYLQPADEDVERPRFPCGSDERSHVPRAAGDRHLQRWEHVHATGGPHGDVAPGRPGPDRRGVRRRRG